MSGVPSATNLACSFCNVRLYSAAAEALVGQPCLTATCSGRLVAAGGRESNRVTYLRVASEPGPLGSHE